MRFAKNRHREIIYVRFPALNHDAHLTPSVISGREFLAFADTGFGTLAQNRIAECQVAIWGDVVERDCVIKCHGLMRDRRCAKIHRVCRPTFPAAAHAAVAAADAALGFQAILTVISTHHFDYKRITRPTEFPLVDPFLESPSDSEFRKADAMGKIQALLSPTHSAIRMLTGARYSFNATRKCCNVPMSLSASENEMNSPGILIYAEISNRRPSVLPRPMILGDCCILYGAILRLRPKTVGICARITLDLLRDSAQMISFSYASAAVNLGSVGGKHAGWGIWIMGNFLKTGRLAQSFARGGGPRIRYDLVVEGTVFAKR